MHLVVAAVLVRDGRVLLGHRSAARAWYPDVWDVPGGHVKDGETPESTLRRELQEELGIRIGSDPGEPTAHVVDPEGQDGGLDIRIWTVTDWAGEVANLAPAEHDELRWFGRHEIGALRLAHPALADLLDRVLDPRGRRRPRGSC